MKEILKRFFVKYKIIILVVLTISVCLIAKIVLENSEFSAIENNIIEESDEVSKLDENETSEAVNSNEKTDENNTPSEASNEATNEEVEDNANKIYIYIIGEVNQPGVVILDEGSRISDAINSAGGTTANADLSKINLVYTLQDGMKINIPNSEQLKKEPDFQYITSNASDETLNESSSGNGSVSASSSSNGSSNDNKTSGSSIDAQSNIVNINTATQTELETLPGIGPSLALRIIEYRKENGKFNNIEEIKNVKGIGEAKYDDIKNHIKV